MYIRYDEADMRDIPIQYDVAWLRRDVNRAQEAIKWLQEVYIPALTAQAQRVIQMDTKHFVYIKREVERWKQNKVWYYVGIKTELWEDGKKFREVYDYQSEINKKFHGTEKKTAFAYFHELKKKYNYPVIIEGIKVK